MAQTGNGAILDQRPARQSDRRETLTNLASQGGFFPPAVRLRTDAYRGRRVTPGTLPPDHEWGHKDGCD